jgi:hypothetical protein
MFDKNFIVVAEVFLKDVPNGALEHIQQGVVYLGPII